MVLQNAKNFTSIDAILQALRALPGTSGKVITDAICLQPNNTFLNILFNGTGNINVTFENPVCNNTVLQDLLAMAVSVARKVLAARTRDEFCRLVVIKAQNSSISISS